MTEVPEHLRKRAEEARAKAEAAKAGASEGAADSAAAGSAEGGDDSAASKIPEHLLERCGARLQVLYVDSEKS